MTGGRPSARPVGSGARLPRWLREAAIVVALLLLAGFLPRLLSPLHGRFHWLIGVWSLLLLLGFALVRTHRLRTAILTGAALAAGLFAAEAGLQAFDYPPTLESHLEGGCASADYWVGANDVGFASESPHRYGCRKIIDGKLAYDVVYSFDAHHLRATAGNRTGDTIIFFGCSITFGEGLDDDQTLPYAVSRQLGFRYNVVNFAFHGYGPHHMLRALERGLPRDLASGRVKRVLYVAAPFHMHRAAGLEPWGQRAPRYELDPDGEPRYAGMGFSSLIPPEPPRWLAASRFARLAWLAVETYRKGRLGWQAELLAAIVKRSARLVHDQLGAPFTVLVWDNASEASRVMIDALKANGLQVVLVGDIVPLADRRRYAIPLDGHPGPQTHPPIAARLAKLIE